MFQKVYQKVYLPVCVYILYILYIFSILKYNEAMDEQVVIKIYEGDRKRLKVLAAGWDANMPDAFQIVLNEWEEAQKKERVSSYIEEQNKADLEEILPKEEAKPYVCKVCGRNYKEDRSEPYCEHVRFTGNAYYLDKYFIRGATQEEIKEYNKQKWEKQYGK